MHTKQNNRLAWIWIFLTFCYIISRHTFFFRGAIYLENFNCFLIYPYSARQGDSEVQRWLVTRCFYMLRCNTMVSFSFKYFAATQTIIIMLVFLSSSCPPAPHTINFNPHLLWRIFDALYFQNKYFFFGLKTKREDFIATETA